MNDTIIMLGIFIHDSFLSQKYPCGVDDVCTKTPKTSVVWSGISSVTFFMNHESRGQYRVTLPLESYSYILLTSNWKLCLRSQHWDRTFVLMSTEYRTQEDRSRCTFFMVWVTFSPIRFSHRELILRSRSPKSCQSQSLHFNSDLYTCWVGRPLVPKVL